MFIALLEASEPLSIAPALLLLALVAFFGLFFKPIVVKQGEVVIIEYLGSFQKVLGPGLHFIFPLFQAERCVNWTYTEEDSHKKTLVVNKKDSRIPVKKQIIFDPEPVRCFTKDKLNVTINVVLTYIIEDPKKCVYDVDDLYRALQSAVASAIQSNLQNMTSDEFSKNLEVLKELIKKDLEIGKTWGIQVTDVKIQDCALPTQIIQAIEKQLTQEKQNEVERKAELVRRELELQKLETEQKLQGKKYEIELSRIKAEAECTNLNQTLTAEAKARALLIEAEAQRKRLEILHGADTGDISEYLVHELHANTFSKIQNKTVILPYDFGKGFGTLPLKYDGCL